MYVTSGPVMTQCEQPCITVLPVCALMSNTCLVETAGHNGTICMIKFAWLKTVTVQLHDGTFGSYLAARIVCCQLANVPNAQHGPFCVCHCVANEGVRERWSRFQTFSSMPVYIIRGCDRQAAKPCSRGASGDEFTPGDASRSRHAGGRRYTCPHQNTLRTATQPGCAMDRVRSTTACTGRSAVKRLQISFAHLTTRTVESSSCLPEKSGFSLMPEHSMLVALRSPAKPWRDNDCEATSPWCTNCRIVDYLLPFKRPFLYTAMPETVSRM